MPPRKPPPKPYAWRRMCVRDREAILEFRKQSGLRWHCPSHFSGPAGWYLLSASCYEHRPIMSSHERRQHVERGLVEGIEHAGGEASAWAVLPNHYHVLARMPSLKAFGDVVRRLHSASTVQWNREDRTPGRKVWYRYADRQIRNERHYYAAFNYVHGNPVKHGLVARADEWIATSLHQHLDALGREYLKELWLRYPPLNMGAGWDET